ncbi:hypothetical protein [Tropicimonas sp.]|uniref:hypothetical protein n=1 Tax=Tropicimonas sp. TaxID=2067044 RepID=UPI003A8AEB7B
MYDLYGRHMDIDELERQIARMRAETIRAIFGWMRQRIAGIFRPQISATTTRDAA